MFLAGQQHDRAGGEQPVQAREKILATHETRVSWREAAQDRHADYRTWKRDHSERRTALLPDEIVTSLDTHGDTARVALRGEVDVLTVDQVRVALAEALAAAPREIVVDLRELSFIDSTGLGALIYGFQRARVRGIHFRLSTPTRAVHQILALSGLLEVVEVTL